MKRNASAEWKGGLKDGKGTISSDSGVLANTQYSFSTRFEDGKGTNPEELIAAAHAGCFSMALSAQLGTMGLTPASIRTSASVSLDKLDDGFAITAVHLVVKASVPGTPQAQESVIANSLPETASIKRSDAKLLPIKYDGQPQLKPIEGTTLSHIVNSPIPVIQVGTSYYALQNAVWFVGTSPQGPWTVAATVGGDGFVESVKAAVPGARYEKKDAQESGCRLARETLVVFSYL